MDYILHLIEKKIKRFEGTAGSKIYHQVRVEYAFNLLLAYFWNKNFEELGISDFVAQGNIIKEIQRPSIGTIASIIEKLDLDKEIEKSKLEGTALTEYAELRNDLIGHGYSFEDDLENYASSFDKWYETLLGLQIPILSRKTNLIACEGYNEQTEDYLGTIYDSDGDENSNWKCPREIFEFEIGNIYASYETNIYFRISPFIHIEPRVDSIYIYRSVQQLLLGKLRYNRIDKSDGDYTKCWKEFEFIANNGIVKKQPNGCIINIFTANYKRYIEIGSIKDKIYEFLTGKEKGSSVCVTLWGHGGNGKTATAQKICEELSLNEKRPFEFIIFLSAKDRELNKYTGKISSISGENRITSFEDLIEKINQLLFSIQSADTSKIISEKSKILFVIDDYETFEDIDKEQITNFIKQLNLNYHKVIITTRNSFLKIGDDIQTNELSANDTIHFLIEILANEHNYTALNLKEVERELQKPETKKEVHRITLGKPIEIIRFVNCFIQKGKFTEEFLREMKKVNSRSERIEFLYGRNYKQLSGDKIAQDIFVVIGLLTPSESLSSLVSHIKLILGNKDEDENENAFNLALDKLVKLRLIEIDDDGSYKVDSKDILEIMKSEYDKRDPNFKSRTKAIYDRIKSYISSDTDKALLNHVKSLRHQSNPETTIQQYKEIIRQGRDFSYEIKQEALFDLGDFLFNHRGDKEAAVKLFDEYSDKFYSFNLVKRHASYTWSINKDKAIKLLESFYSKTLTKDITLNKHQRVHLLGLIVMREGQFWNDKFEREFSKRQQIKEELSRINRAYGHLLISNLKSLGNNIQKDLNSEELFDISLALESFVDLSFRIYNKSLALEVCELVLKNFPEKFNTRFKKKKEKLLGQRNSFRPSTPQSTSSDLGDQIKNALLHIEIINLELNESGYQGTVLRTYSDKTKYGYIMVNLKDVNGRVYFRESSLKGLKFDNLKTGDKVKFGFGKIAPTKFGAINVQSV
ncbi:MAG TPA: NB-ARC domain-containing protein [Ohtaekwangia sp.]|uniref:NB-ARC domain-containing protein n=1 Tax=Ohtaekwangia sp. TaxID=2066019 RepID=UPI002F942325